MFVTPLYAGLLALWFLVLSWRVIQRRGKGTYLGDGGDQALLRVIRGHANFAEYVPLALLMMGFLEVSRYSIYVLHVLGIVLFVARLLHGYALSFTEHFSFGRLWGSTLTFIVLAIEAVLCIYQGIQGQWIWCCAR
ncbi:MAG TPA: MAPEG family protein [Casimicrobiaceae bacterium]|nr:MAPEG family protein [Casimicrobiaceae bacterium]